MEPRQHTQREEGRGASHRHPTLSKLNQSSPPRKQRFNALERILLEPHRKALRPLKKPRASHWTAEAADALLCPPREIFASATSSQHFYLSGEALDPTIELIVDAERCGVSPLVERR